MAEDEGFDPITLEIFWSRLISIADEAAAALLRTAFSTIVRESNDYATVLMDRNGDSLSENTGGIASLLLHPAAHHQDVSWRNSRPKTWRPGDCVITNDPWLATGHLPDITIVSADLPRGALVGFAGSIAHSPGHRRRALVGRLPRAVRGGHPHPADAVPARGRAERRAVRLHPRQRPRAATRCSATSRRR